MAMKIKLCLKLTPIKFHSVRCLDKLDSLLFLLVAIKDFSFINI